MAVYFRTTELVRDSIPLELVPSARKAIEAEIERLIELLDTVDGDCDLEDDDPAGGNVDDEGEFDRSISPLAPRFGVDQSGDPTNVVELRAAHREQEDRIYAADYDRCLRSRRAAAA